MRGSAPAPRGLGIGIGWRSIVEDASTCAIARCDRRARRLRRDPAGRRSAMPRAISHSAQVRRPVRHRPSSSRPARLDGAPSGCSIRAASAARRQRGAPLVTWDDRLLRDRPGNRRRARALQRRPAAPPLRSATTPRVARAAGRRRSAWSPVDAVALDGRVLLLDARTRASTRTSRATACCRRFAAPAGLGALARIAERRTGCLLLWDGVATCVDRVDQRGRVLGVDASCGRRSRTVRRRIA